MRKKNLDLIRNILENLYSEAYEYFSRGEQVNLENPYDSYLNNILEHAEIRKGVLSAVLTLLVYKIYDPDQDIRLHRAEFEKGFNARGIDTNYTTPFLKEKGFPAMAESGWLTRSLEQPHPYDLKYPGKITPRVLKEAFLQVIHGVQTGNLDPYKTVVYLLKGLIELKERKPIKLPRPLNLTIEDVVKLLEKHFNYTYKSRGASRLPVLAIYAIYKILSEQVEKYRHKHLRELLPHHASDDRSGVLGDINVDTMEGYPYEVIDVKDRPVDYGILLSVYNKIKSCPPKYYYILTTSSYTIDDDMRKIIKESRLTYGAQIIINGVLPTIRYYLRLVNDVALFINNYVDLIEKDRSISMEHKEAWIIVCTQLTS